MAGKTSGTSAEIDKGIFLPGIITILAVVVFMIVFEESSKKVIDVVFNFCTDQLGSLYLWFGAFALGFCGWLGFGRYGNVRLGGPDAKPEFSRWSWIAMFFCSGIGTSLIYWATIEWTYYYTSPPFAGIEAKSQAAAQWAAMYPIYHWGPIGWVLYLLCAFPIGYAYYNRNMPSLRLSTGCAGVIGEKNAKNGIGKFIDILMIFGLVGGTGTSLASGTPMLAEAVSQMLGVAHTPMVDMAVVVVWTALFTTSVTLGLKKGIKVLSDINVIAVFVLCAIIFVFGPTAFLISMFTDSMGLMLDNFARMSFYTDPVGRSMFPQWWTIFYWAWWIAYGPYMGIFIARISKGRTFRDLAVTVTLAGAGGCALFFMVFGNTAMYYELNNIYPVLATIKDQSASAAILGVLHQMPLWYVVLPLFVLVGFVYSATTVDSSAYAIAVVASKDTHGDHEPNLVNRAFWAIALGAIALVLMKLGGLGPLKTASIVVSVPLIVLMGISVVSLLRWLKEDQADLVHAKSTVIAERNKKATAAAEETKN
ncbi:BCCT family transporter [Desulfopila aestuarii]|uniref:Betaine/carnitine transporter, BCCT family n=1 Tax=Desulfopila aestuarii DSM 18488 TaxID=1121416 RepID=A0A1M7YFY4_9BACT|nr:BCCT family transporter [Desulfopila aestuarii]SHO51555.1 betaine/carnitine transporter, BCCT family [Desulfopila aestuarii DSM 18488]